MLMLQPYGIKLGLKELSKLHLTSSFKHLLLPVNYWRNLEYKIVYKALNVQPSDTVLDIGSPKLFALYLAKKIGCKVYATDIESYFIKEYHKLRVLEGIAPERLALQVEDGRNLSFRDNFFDKIYSISVLEHIPQEGDKDCAAEVGRVLKRGGLCAVTVPFSRKSKVDYTTDDFYWARSSVKGDDGRVFFQRRYSEQDLYNRIIEPSGLHLKVKKYYGERVMRNSPRELSEYLPKITGPIQPLLSNILHTEGSDASSKLKKPLCALIVLEKN